MDPIAVEHIREVIHDKNRLLGKFIELGANAAGIEAERFAIYIAGMIALHLAFGENPKVVANFIIVAAPLFVYVFSPQERPHHEDMLVYCAFYILTTALDLSLAATIPFYFLVKVIFHICLFLRPYCLARKVVEWTDLNKETKNDEVPHKLFSKEELQTLSNRKDKSPPPEKPEGDKAKNTGSPPAESGAPQSTEIQSIPTKSPSANVRTAVSPSVAHQIFDQPHKGLQPGGANPMEQSPSSYQLATPTATSPSSSSSSDSRGINKYDVVFEPKDCLVFNAPFDYAHLTYIMRLTNTSRFKIGFALKSNAIPRVTASPPNGIINAKKSMDIAVTVQRMDNYAENEYPKDRIAIDYVRVPREADKFEFKHIYVSPMKLRKNIRIKYNA